MKKSMSTLVLLFFAMVMLFQKDISTTELQFVRNDDEVFLHNAPNTQWDYLFENEWGQDIYQGQINTGTIDTQSTENIDNTESLEGLIQPDDIKSLLEEQTSWTTSTENLFTWTLTTGVQQTGTIKTGSIDCVTPRGEQVKHKDFVLAYRQRKDVNTICDIEKRVCISGTLLWSFTQDFCKDDIVYEYQKAKVISYNQKVLNEYIQPTKPVNEWAEFSTEGKINDTNKPIDTRDTSNAPVTLPEEVDQTQINKKKCVTPRNQTIEHGQFIKAYKAPRGFIDLPCDVQIRACVNGTLKGSFTYSKCTFNNTTYTDYLTAGSPASNTGFIFFERIKKILKKK